MFYFCTPWKHQKTYFLSFLGSIEGENLLNMSSFGEKLLSFLVSVDFVQRIIAL